MYLRCVNNEMEVVNCEIHHSSNTNYILLLARTSSNYIHSTSDRKVLLV